MAIQTKTDKTEMLLRKEIASGRWSPGQLLPGERELLEELGVSRTTLRHAFSALANEGLIVRKKCSGTFVSPEVKAGEVALVADAEDMTSTQGYYIRRLVEEAQESVVDQGYRALLAVGHGKSTDEFISSTQLLDKSSNKGIIGALNLETTELLQDRLSAEGIHCVTLGPSLAVEKYCVLRDNRCAANLAREIFEAHGYDDFALMSYDISGWPLRGPRKDLYKEERHILMSTVDFRADRLIAVPYSPGTEEAYSEFKRWWAKPNRAHAIFFPDDSLFDVASRAILELGIRVPEELAIIVQTYVRRPLHFPVPLYRIEFDPSELIATAWEMLLKLLSGEHVQDTAVYVRPHIREGESLSANARNSIHEEGDALN